MEGKGKAPQWATAEEPQTKGQSQKSPLQDEPPNRGHLVYEGPKTAEEQYHSDLPWGEIGWVREADEPHTAYLLAEVLGVDSFEMDVAMDEEEKRKDKSRQTGKRQQKGNQNREVQFKIDRGESNRGGEFSPAPVPNRGLLGSPSLESCLPRVPATGGQLSLRTPPRVHPGEMGREGAGEAGVGGIA